MSKHPRWESMRKVVDELHRGGWFTPKLLVEAINRHEETKVNVRSVKNNLRLGSYIHIFKHDDSKDQYAWIDYESEEPKILEAIEEYLSSHSSLRGKPFSAVSIDEIIDDAAAKAGRDPRELEYRKLGRSVIKRYERKALGRACGWQSSTVSFGL